PASSSKYSSAERGLPYSAKSSWKIARRIGSSCESVPLKSKMTARARTAPRDYGRTGEAVCPCSRDRRRSGGLLDHVLARSPGLGRRRPVRARRPHERVDVPLGGPRRSAPRLAQPDQDDDELGRALPPAWGRGRPRARLARGRLP